MKQVNKIRHYFYIVDSLFYTNQNSCVLTVKVQINIPYMYIQLFFTKIPISAFLAIFIRYFDITKNTISRDHVHFVYKQKLFKLQKMKKEKAT